MSACALSIDLVRGCSRSWCRYECIDFVRMSDLSITIYLLAKDWDCFLWPLNDEA